MWRRHPDGLALLRAAEEPRTDPSEFVIIAVNPAMAEFFGDTTLVGQGAERLAPASRLRPGSERETSDEVFLAQRADGSSFPATCEIVALAPPDDVMMLVLHDVSRLVAWPDRLTADDAERLSDLKSTERAIADQREMLAQHLYAAGIALQLCQSAGATDVSQQRLERAVDVLDHVMNELIAFQRSEKPSIPETTVSATRP